MNRIITLTAAVILIVATMSTAVYAGETAQTDDGTLAQADELQAEDTSQDNIVTTKHTAVIQGQELAYTVDTGTMVLETRSPTNLPEAALPPARQNASMPRLSMNFRCAWNVNSSNTRIT